jgi:predicted TIM-barrel fold metal-dependent hydrolase
MALELGTVERSEVRGFEGLALIDCDVHNDLTAEKIPSFLTTESRRFLEQTGRRSWSLESPLRVAQRPFAARVDAVPPSGGVPGSDPEFAREQLLDEYGISAAIINFIGLGSGNMPLKLEREMARAANESNATWLESDDRWLASIVCCQADPIWTVGEIDRCRDSSERYVQVLLDPHGERPAGNPMYWPIYEAAVRHDIPVAFHITGQGKTRLSTGVGATTYYCEQRTSLDILAQPLVASMIFEGVFDRWPELRVASIETDWTWVVPLAWRLDSTWKVLRSEVPDLKRRPSEYLRDHFWFSTQPGVDTEHPDQLLAIYEQLERAGMGDKLMFATDYPHWDMDSPFETIPRRLPRDSKERILAGNAAALYGLELNNGG